MNIFGKAVNSVKNVFRDQPGKPTVDQRLMSALRVAQNLPKAKFESQTVNNMRPGLNKTAAQVGMGAAESLVNSPANLITGSTIVGEQLGNALTKNHVQWGRAAQGAKQLGSSLMNGAMVQGAYNVASRPFSRPAELPRVIPQSPKAPVIRMIPIKQGGKQIGQFDIGMTAQDLDPEVMKKIVKMQKFFIRK